MTYHRDLDAWQGDPADNMIENEEPAEGVRALAIRECYPGVWEATDADNYDGPGDICETGVTLGTAAGAWANEYGERMYVRALTEAYDAANALGGTTPRGDRYSDGYNTAIDDVLGMLVDRGALTVAERKRRNSR